MSDFEHILLSEQKNPNALVLEFINSEYDKSDVVAFVEGIHDPQFYYDLIAAIVPDRQIRFFDCGGKKSVICVREFIQQYNLVIVPDKILYLCDLDFDLILRKEYPGVFQTKFYSIESYFADSSYIEYLFSKYCATTIKKAVRTKILQKIDQEIATFLPFIVAPMALLCNIREHDHAADFDKLSIVDFVNIENIGVSKCKNRLSAIAHRTGSSMDKINIKKIYIYAKEMNKLHYKYWMRGKLALQLLKVCVRRASHGLHEAAQPAINTLCNHIGSAALSQSKNFLKTVPDLEKYVLSA